MVEDRPMAPSGGEDRYRPAGVTSVVSGSAKSRGQHNKGDCKKVYLKRPIVSLEFFFK